ncbi:DEAD/DEAH box helicase [Paenibacillus sp. CAU 1782]
MSKSFTALSVQQELCEALAQNGINEPTAVQSQSIPRLFKGEDVIAQAQTGTGKTLAFALPMLQRIQPGKEQVQGLILTPTRELALQITVELKKLAPVVGATVLAAYGGQDVDAQIRKLQNSPHIVVATPGRLIDHMNRGTINLGKISMLVLDEADQMLHMGFLPEVESIIVQTPKARQTMLFSATMPDAVRRLAGEYMNDPVDITVQSRHVTLDSINQLVVETTDRGKQNALIHLLEQHTPYLAVVFCRTKVRAKKLNEALQDYGLVSDELHGDLTQAKREQVMRRFREARLQILVATDVAARGLDVEGVTHVYNYDMPLDAESYIHRIGRTGRAGHDGMAVTLTTPYDTGKLAAIERGIQAGLKRVSIDREGQISDSQSSARRSSGARGGSTRSGDREESAGRGSARKGARGTEGRGPRRGEGAGRGSEDRGGRRGGSPGRGGADRRNATSGRSSSEGRRSNTGRGPTSEGRSSSAEGRGSARKQSSVSTGSVSGNPWEAGETSGVNSRGGRNDRSGGGSRSQSSRGSRDGAARGGRSGGKDRPGGRDSRQNKPPGGRGRR